MCYESSSGAYASSSCSSSSCSRKQQQQQQQELQMSQLLSQSTMREAFDLLDRDGDGNIAESDLTEFLQQQMTKPRKAFFKNKTSTTNLWSPDEIKRMIAVADINGDGAVSFDEFRTQLLLLQQKYFITEEDKQSSVSTAAASAASVGPGSYLEDVFRVLDRNGDGILCSEDLEQVMSTAMPGQAFSADDLAEMLETASGGSSHSFVSFQDFVRFMTASSSPSPSSSTAANLTKVF